METVQRRDQLARRSGRRSINADLEFNTRVKRQVLTVSSLREASAEKRSLLAEVARMEKATERKKRV